MKRGFSQIISAGILNSYFSSSYTKGLPLPVFNCHACPLASFGCPIGALQYAAMNRIFLFYPVGILMGMGAIAGRWSCGWVCPFGFIQDKLFSLSKKRLSLPSWLKYLKYLLLPTILIIAFLTQKLWFCRICPVGGLEASLPYLFLHPAVFFYGLFLSWFFKIKLLLLVSIIILSIFISRPFCRICPIGLILGFFNRVSLYQIRVDRERCDGCGACEAICPMGMGPLSPSIDCIRCLECVKVCHSSALSFRKR